MSGKLGLSVNALKVLEKRYLTKDEEGRITETPEEMFRRVAENIAQVDLQYDKNAEIDALQEEFYHLMTGLKFLPNSPTLMNAGTSLNQLSACFVLPVEDSIEGIFDSLKHMALIHKSGGGVGFSFSKIRPAGDVVRSTKGIASGPISFMHIYDAATDVIKQGGRRRGANMSILQIDHPNILEFITVKEKRKENSGKLDEKEMTTSRREFRDQLTNFNLSVAVDDEFIQKVQDDNLIELVNPRNNGLVMSVPARMIFDLMVHTAWESGDPGILFMDEINRHNPTPQLGLIQATNPCGEQPLLPYESCNLGSINLARMVENGFIQWDKLKKTIKTAVHFLDNVIDANQYPLPEIESMTFKTRKIGLGVMGFADLLILLGIPYNSQEALDIARKIAKFISETARESSVELGEIKGSFPAFNKSKWDKKGYSAMRNATTTTIAPTGSISIIAGVSSGIEPLFAVSFQRDVLDGSKLLEINSLFQKIALKRGFYSEKLMLKIARKGSLTGLREIPADIRQLFVTTYDIDPSWQVRMQAAFQEHVDNAVSKTVNLPSDATPEDVKKVFLLAHQLKCKGITVYRYGSKEKQVLYVGVVPDNQEHEYLNAKSEYSGGCPSFICIH
ncbi:adenosylcobalamin-dependent ribonucleoside-diphosphate reductase [Methanobacterium petrolearium]|uniref:adenosylcobalamin-dependent ribonucleoside-diphosphate reductase n=1 Tax=Methanobacterium petrolearium TaxID=710190 RepID=UPI001AE3462D